VVYSRWEAEIRKISVPDQSEEKSWSWWCMPLIPAMMRKPKIRGSSKKLDPISEAVERLSPKHKALSSNLSTTKRNE
jgi:hypothetical protein